MPRPRNRGRARTSLRSTRASLATASSPPADVDEDMPDAPAPVETPPPSNHEEEPVEVEEPAEEDEPEFVVQKEPSEKSLSPPIEVPRKRRIGRPPKYPRPERELGRDDGSEGTPQRRRRGRPPGAGWRGRGRGGTTTFHAQKVKIDKEGTLADVEKDEVVVPEDPEGETKVDKDGNLLGGREYRVRTFTILNRLKRLYMLSTEPARCTGFRDSYLFFTKHLKLYKVIIDEDEKRDLIDREVIPHSYKGRSIGVVTARSVFREFGARIVVGGRKIIDDYYVSDYRARGDIEGELADPNDRLPPEGQPYNRNQYVAWHGASAVYHTNMPNIPILNGKAPPGKRKIQITSANWQFEHARAASQFNSLLAASRKKNWFGIYDAHTNSTHFPKSTQPTHIKWEQITPKDDDEELTNGHITNGISTLTNGDHKESRTMFKPVSKKVARNFMVTDISFASPPIPGVGTPGPDNALDDVTSNGLPDASPETLAELPEECRVALLEAKKQEQEWKTTWGTESTDGMRSRLKIGYLGFPV